jgi:hypothetical protein
MEFEAREGKAAVEGSEMKRNKRTEILAHDHLTPLTEHVLTQMGEAGNAIRRRLKRFYQARAMDNEAPSEEHLEESA